MTHPFGNIRQHDVERSRVAHIARGYATGGAVSSDVPVDGKAGGRTGKSLSLKMEGGVAKSRADRPGRAKGGRAPKAKTNVNVIIAPQGAQNSPASAMGPSGLPPPKPAMPPPAGPPPGMAMPPPGMAGPPGMPPRANGGRTYATGGGVKRADGGVVEGLKRYAGKIKLRDEMGGKPPGTSFKSQRDPQDADDQMRGQMQRAQRISDEVPRPDRARGGGVNSGTKVFNASMKAGTQMMHSDGKNDGKQLGRGKPVTYATGGPVFASATGQHGPKFIGGNGGLTRMQEASRAARLYKKAP